MRRVWRQLSRKRRLQFGLLLLLMMIASVAEVVSIGSVLPFLGVLTAPDRALEFAPLKPLLRNFGLTTGESLLLPLTIAFCGAAILAGIVRLGLLWMQTRFSNALNADFSIQVYERTLYQPYSVHVARNSSEILAGIAKTNSLIQSIIHPALTLLGSSLILLAVLSTLLMVAPVVTAVAMAGFSLIYGGIIRFTRHRVARNGHTLALLQGRVTKATQEGLGGIRDILLDGSQPTYTSLYRRAFRPLQRAGADNYFINSSPRLGIEALGMVLIGCLAYGMTSAPGGLNAAIPVLGALALGAQRLLPLLQGLYSAYIYIRSGMASSSDALDLLEQPLPEGCGQPLPPLPFRHALSLQQLSFRYSAHSPWVLQGINLQIPRGSRIGFIGATGSGKSTLLDIIMGLLEPTAGNLLIDGVPLAARNARAWQCHVAHVPQSIYLADISIAENIAFGVPPEQIDHERVRRAAHRAQIGATIESWQLGYATLVGERGVRLSGGQRQRLGIARALYKQASVIIFDEATSALDNQTEHAVMEAIDSLDSDLTVLIIAHRLSTLRNCNQIVELEQGRVKGIASYAEVMRSQELATGRLSSPGMGAPDNDPTPLSAHSRPDVPCSQAPCR